MNAILSTPLLAQRRAGLAVAGDPTDQSVRRIRVRLVERFDGIHAGGGAVLARLHHRSVAGCERVGQPAVHGVDREVPRRDDPDDAERQVLQSRVEVRHGDTRGDPALAEYLLGVRRGPAQILEAGHQFELHVTLRLAGLAVAEVADLVGVLGDPRNPLADPLPPSGKPEIGPPLLGGAGLVDGGFHIVGGVHREGADHLVGDRVGHLEDLGLLLVELSRHVHRPVVVRRRMRTRYSFPDGHARWISDISAGLFASGSPTCRSGDESDDHLASYR